MDKAARMPVAAIKAPVYAATRPIDALAGNTP